MTLWTSNASNTGNREIQSKFVGNYFDSGDSWTTTLHGTTVTQITARFSNQDGSQRDIVCYYQDNTMTNTKITFDTKAIAGSASDVELIFTGSQAIVASGNFVIFFRGDSSTEQQIRFGTTCSGECPEEMKNTSSFPTFNTWIDESTIAYSPMSITYGAGPPPASTGTRLPPSPITVQI